MAMSHSWRAVCAGLLFPACLLTGNAYAGGPPDGAPAPKFATLQLVPETSVAHGHGAGPRAGVLRYTPTAPAFTFQLNAHGLRPMQDYTLLYLPEPHEGLVCLAADRSNVGGVLVLNGSPDLNSDLPIPADANYPHGARMVLALSSDVDCHNQRMLVWDPASYLFGRKLIRYHDTDAAVDYSGNYCMVMTSPGRTASFEMQVVQSGTTIGVTVDGISAMGTLSGQTATLSGVLPDDGAFTMVLNFAADGEGFTGTLTIGAEVNDLSGARGDCWDYEFPPGDPVCNLPIADLSLVTGGQQYNSVSGDVTHTGLDFKFASPLPAITAPCDGVVVEISRHAISLGNIIVDVGIRYNDEWTTFIAFEPYSPDPMIADAQEAQIAVEVNQIVRRGDLLGHLVVPDPITEFPHIHWGVNRSDAGRTPVCPRDTLTPEGQVALDTLYGSFGLLPACLP